MSGIKRLIIACLGSLMIIFYGCNLKQENAFKAKKENLLPIQYALSMFDDDLEVDSLILAIERNLDYLEKLDPQRLFQYGPHQFTCQQVFESQIAFLQIISLNKNPRNWAKKIKNQFLVYEVSNSVNRKKVLFTGYYEPIISASMSKNADFQHPIYKKPEDLIRLNLSKFKSSLSGESIMVMVEGKTVQPYYSREKIDMGKALKGRGLELAWLRDPIDVIFLHIQGSGRLKFPDGRIVPVGYSATNGRPYRSIGRYLLKKGYLSKAQMSMQNIRKFLTENPMRLNETLSYNPSYIFFQVKQNGPLGNINVRITPGRSIALDSKLFPKGALCFISCKKPIINKHQEITDWTDFSRFALNQDTGGAIKGYYRADLFFGSSAYAELAAGNLKHKGRLYVLIKKPSAQASNEYKPIIRKSIDRYLSQSDVNGFRSPVHQF